MADFCKACSEELFGEDNHDLASRGGDFPLQKDHGYPVICEGCGFILVDKDGVCIQCDLKPGESGHGPVETWHTKRGKR